MEITLYSTHCPKCNVLTKKLNDKNIAFTEVNDVAAMRQKKYLSVPVLELDGKPLQFKEAVDWVNSQEG